jgi:large subunit ribosomal protein L25
MAQPATLSAEPRRLAGKSLLTQLRREGKIPGVMYGHKQTNTPIQLDGKSFEQFLKRHGPGGLIEVELGADRELTMIKEVQHHPVTGRVLHLDLLRVSMEDRIHAEVPIVLTGDTIAVTDNAGVIEQQLTELSVVCRADHLPEQIVIDLSELQVGQTITVADLSLPEGVEATHSPDAVVVAATRTAAGRGVEAAEAAETAEAAGAAEAPAEI